MFNQKGQAFSVFELMIAAIVAIAILFVLLPIINNITTPTGDAVSTLSKSLSSISVGGTATTSTFAVKPREVVRSTDFGDSGADPCSVYFDTETNFYSEDNPILDTASMDTDSDALEQEYRGAGDCDAFFVNTTTRIVTAKATIVCDSTPSDLESRLKISGKLGDLVESPTDYWDEDEEGHDPGYNKICVVILERA